MSKPTYPIPEGSRLILTSCDGDIELEGREGDEVILKGQAVEATEAEGTLELAPLRGAYKVLVPKQTPVTIRNASGNLSIKRLAGDVTVETAHGNLSLRYLDGATVVRETHGQMEARELRKLHLAGVCHGDVSLRRIGDLDVQEVNGDMSLAHVRQAARVVRVSGDLRASDVAGPLTIDEVEGDLRVRDVAGRLFVNHVSGDMTALGLAGGASVEEVGGDVEAGGMLAPGQEYRFRAYGDIDLRLPADAHVRLDVAAPVGRVRNELTVTVEQEDRHRLVGVMNPPAADAPGPAPAVVILVSAKGDVRLRPYLTWGQEMGQWGEQFGREMGQWGEQFGREMGAWGEQFGREMGRLGEEIGQEIAAAFEGVHTESIRTGQAAEHAARVRVHLGHRVTEVDVDDLVRRSKEAAAAGIRKAQEAMSRALAGLERDASPTGAAARRTAASDEEKLAILKMIETGRITAAEGELLLDALEGKQ